MLLYRLTIDEVDAERILALRTRVLRPHFSDSNLAQFDGDQAPSTHHFAALDDHQVVAVISYFLQKLPHEPSQDEPSQQAVRLRGMAVEPDLQGQGVGSHLLTTTLMRLPLLYPTVDWVWCNARKQAVAFYRRQGFETFGEPFDIESIGPHHRMKRRIPTAIG